MLRDVLKMTPIYLEANISGGNFHLLDLIRSGSYFVNE